MKKEIKERLEYLRGEFKKGDVSYGEIAELQSLAKYIDKGDVELLEMAGVPEFECPHEDNITYGELFQEDGVPKYKVHCEDCGADGIIDLGEVSEEWGIK
jgi:hypothetical protein